MHHSEVEAQDWEDAKGLTRKELFAGLHHKSRPGNLELPKAARSVNLAKPMPFSKPMDGEKTFRAGELSHQLGYESCLLATELNEDPQIQNNNNTDT